MSLLSWLFGKPPETPTLPLKRYVIHPTGESQFYVEKLSGIWNGKPTYSRKVGLDGLTKFFPNKEEAKRCIDECVRQDIEVETYKQRCFAHAKANPPEGYP